MILAAGFGKRLQPLTDHTPKPLVAVAGVPVLARVLAAVKKYGVKRVIINSHHLAPLVESYMRGDGEKILGNTPYHVVYEPTILETGGGVKNALGLLGGGAFFVINGDGFWDDDNLLKNLADGFAPTMAARLALVPPQQLVTTSVMTGDFTMARNGNGNGNGNGKIERGKGAAGAMVFSGVQILTPALFDGVDENYFSLNVIYDRAAARGQLHGMAMAGRFFTIGTVADITLAESQL